MGSLITINVVCNLNTFRSFINAPSKTFKRFCCIIDTMSIDTMSIDTMSIDTISIGTMSIDTISIGTMSIKT